MDRNSDSDVSRSSPFTVTFALISALVFFFLVYYPRTALTIQESDGAEFALAAVKGSLVHPPGYPLYSWLTELIVRVFPSNPYHALALFSALCQAAAVGVLITLLSTLSGSVPVGAALAVAWGLYEPSIRTGTDVEVFALHHLLIVVAAGLAVLISNAKSDIGRLCLFFGIVIGLAAAHHHLLLLFVPLLMGLAWSGRKQSGFTWQSVLNPVIGIAAVLYLSLFLRFQRAPDLAFTPLVSGVDFLSYLLRGGYGTFSLVLEGPESGISYFSMFLSGVARTLPVALVMSIFILPLALLKRSPPLLGALMTLIFALCFARGLVLPPPEGEYREWVMRFYPGVALAIVLTAALSFSYLPAVRKFAAIVLCVITFTISAASARGALVRADLSRDSAVADEVGDVLKSAPQSALLIAGSDRLVFGLGYFQTVLGVRPDVMIVSADMLESESYREALLKKLNANPRVKQQSMSELGAVAALAFIGNRAVLAEPGIALPEGLSAAREGVFTTWSRQQPVRNSFERGRAILQLCGRWPNSLADVPAARVRSRQILRRAFIDPLEEYIAAFPSAATTPILIEALSLYRLGNFESARAFCK